MNKYKYLVISDLDGTLLNSELKVSQATVDYVHELNKRDDVLFMFSTGRDWLAAKDIYEQLNLKGFVSLSNGAFLYDPHQELCIYTFISETVWRPLLEDDLFLKNLKEARIFTNKGRIIYTNLEGRNSTLKKIKEEKANVYNVKLFYNQTVPEQDILDKEKRIRFLKSLPSPCNLFAYIFPGQITVDFEFQNKVATKGSAVDFFSDYYGVDKKNIITLGDQINDLPAAFSKSFFVAMKNSQEFVKQKADKLSDFTNDEDAVIKEVELFLNNK